MAPGKLPSDKQAGRPSQIDGIVRTDQREAAIDDCIAGTFTTGAGQEVLKYLRSITIERVCGPEASSEFLRHLEGQRFLVGIIEARLASAEQRRKNA